MTNSSGCATVTTQNITVNGTTYGNYAYRMPLTLNTTNLGISSDLTNFPFLVTITDPSLVVAASGCSNKVQFPAGSSYDFAFVDAVAGEVPYQVDNYDPVAGTLQVWVKLPTLTRSVNNTLSFYFGSNTANTANTPSNVWASDYQAVYHFNEAAYTGSAIDGTANGHTGTTTGMTAADLVAGKVGTAYSFNGSTKKIGANTVAVSGPFTLSAWVNLSSTGHDQKVITNQASAGSSTGGYKLGVYTDNTPESESGAAVNRTSTPASPALAANTWHYIQSVYTGSTLSTYVDGVQYKIMSTTTNPSATNPLFIGVGEGGTNYYFWGLIDEPRVSNVAKTADWLTAEYKNQNTPASYTTAGTMATNYTNASAIKGGITYTTTDGVNFTYTINSTTSSGTPPNDGTANFIINGASVTQPAAATIYQLTVNSAAKINLNGQTLNVGCNIVNNGTITDQSTSVSTINFNGAGATQTYTGTSSNTMLVDNLAINNTNASGATITITGGNVSVARTLDVNTGNLVVNNSGNGSLTLLSTAAQTANVDILPATSSIIGKVNVQRFITGNSSSNYRGYRLLSTPVNITSATASATGANYMDLSTLKTPYTLNGTTYYGAFTGGTGAGFSVTNANPTIYFFKETVANSNTTFTSGKNIGVTGISSGTVTLTDGTTYNMPVGNGFILYYVGSTSGRTTGAASVVPDNATITHAGYINQGTIPVNLWYTPGGAALNSLKLSYTSTLSATSNYRGFNMVGNPYPCTIDLAKVYSDNYNATSNKISGNFYELYDVAPNQKYVVYSADGTTSSATLSSQYVASGQGFLTLANAAGQSLVFKEDQKVASQQPTGSALILSAQLNKPALSAAVQSVAGQISGLHLKMEKDSTLFDECGIYFRSDWADQFDNDDAYDLGGINLKVSLSSYSSDKVRTSINKMGDYTNGKIVKLYVSATSDGFYNLNMNAMQNIDTTLYDIYLRDKYKKDSLDIRRYKQYNFNIVRSDTNSFGANRFELVIMRRALPAYQLVSFKGSRVTGGAQLVWKTYNEGSYTGFTLQRMDGTQQFVPIYQLQSDGHGTYTYLDKAAVNGMNHYKLMSNDVNSQTTYSGVVSVLLGDGNSEGLLLSVFPNPVASTIRVTLTDDNAAATAGINLQVRVMSTNGQVMSTLKSSGNMASADISHLTPGTYVIEAIDSQTKKLYGRKVFVKL